MATRPLLAALLLLLPALPAGAADAVRFPFFPSLINSPNGEPLPASAFVPSSRCKGCHAQIFDQWNGSMHSAAFRDPIFDALWRLAADKAGEDTSRLCAGCHTAAGVLAKEVKRTPEGGFRVPSPADEGVHCHLCHSVTGTSAKDSPTGLPQNASLVVDPGLVMRGPYDDARPMWHQAAYSELHTRAEFCGSCHNVFHPVNNFHIEDTYSEWKASPYAASGIVCQDCHMMPLEKAAEAARTMEIPKNPGKASPMGPERPNVHTHEFTGGNFTVPPLLGGDRHADLARGRLQRAAEIALSLPASARPGEQARAVVKVTNVGAGHNLPTSLTEVRQMWLAVTVADASGRVVFSSGAPDAKGDLPEGTVLFGSEAVDAQGRPTVFPWEMVRFDHNRTIPPKGSVDTEFAFVVPPGAQGPLAVEAVLRYRSYPQAVANLLLGDKAPRLPVVDMARASGALALQ